jgi:hypothetical protein
MRLKTPRLLANQGALISQLTMSFAVDPYIAF